MREITTFDQGNEECVGTAYYRLPKEVKEFLELCEKKHKIIGFSWEVGSYNFGVILGEPNEN